MAGDAACWIPAATYGDRPAATFDTWRKETLAAWRTDGAGPTVYTSGVDIDPLSCSVAPALGEFVFDIRQEPDQPRIAGIRATPHSFDVHDYQVKRSPNRPTKAENPVRARRSAIGRLVHPIDPHIR